MAQGYYAALCAILLANGCTFKRQGKGSHEIGHSPVNGQTFPVAVTVNNRHTANGILKQAGIQDRL